MKRKRWFAILLCVVMALALLPAAALAYDFEIHLSSNPDDIAAFIPLKGFDSEKLTLNDVAIRPDIDPDNRIALMGGDLLAVAMITEDSAFLEGLDSGAQLDVSDVFVRHGKVYLQDSPLDARDEDRLAIWSSSDWLAGDPSRRDAMRLLEGQTYSLKSDGNDVLNIGIGNVWQAPIPGDDYDPLSDYVPPEIPPKHDAEGEGDSTALVMDWVYDNDAAGKQTVTQNEAGTGAVDSAVASCVEDEPEGFAYLRKVELTVYTPDGADFVLGLLYQGENEYRPSGSRSDDLRTTWYLMWETTEAVLDLAEGFTSIDVYVDPTLNDSQAPTSDPTYTIENEEVAVDALDLALAEPLMLMSAGPEAPAADEGQPAPEADAPEGADAEASQLPAEAAAPEAAAPAATETVTETSTEPATDPAVTE